jgi:hypothetical protein
MTLIYHSPQRKARLSAFLRSRFLAQAQQIINHRRPD